jgi:hypothetical protein
LIKVKRPPDCTVHAVASVRYRGELATTLNVWTWPVAAKWDRQRFVRTRPTPAIEAYENRTFGAKMKNQTARNRGDYHESLAV